MKRLKSEKGITLISLIAYMILVAAALGILGSITNFMYGNTSKFKSNSRYSSEYDRFNSNFLRDTQKYNHAIVENFEDGSVRCRLVTAEDDLGEKIIDEGVSYTYEPSKKSIVRRAQDGIELEVARNIHSANFTFKTPDNNKNKKGVQVHLEIGPSGQVNTQDIYYVLKFW